MQRISSKSVKQTAIVKRGRKRINVTLPESQRKYLSRLGGPEYEPVDAMRPIIMEMVAAGLSQERIARLVINPRTGEPISVPTLKKYYQRQLDTGLDTANLEMSRSAFAQGIGFPGIPNPRYLMIDKRKYVDGFKNASYGKVDKTRWSVPPIAAQPAMTIWWEKTRAGKKEVSVHEQTGPNGQPLPPSQTIIILPPNGRETGGTPILDRLPYVAQRTIDAAPHPDPQPAKAEGHGYEDRRRHKGNGQASP